MSPLTRTWSKIRPRVIETAGYLRGEEDCYQVYMIRSLVIGNCMCALSLETGCLLTWQTFLYIVASTM